MANGIMTDISGDGSARVFTYDLTTADPTGAAMTAVEWGQRSLHASGTWSGATLILEGSNDGGVTWAQLRDPAGTLLSFTANGLKSVMELTQYMRPRLSVVGTVAVIEVSILVRRDNPMRT